MKIFFFLVVLFIANLLVAQNPYDQLKGEFRTLFDPIPIDKGQEEAFFTYAIQLYQQDSLKKAGQLFDRLYWLDTAGVIGKKSLAYRNKIEEQVLRQTRGNLKGPWIWGWSASSWAPPDSSSLTKKGQRIELNDTTIIFYRNDSLIRRTRYTLNQRFDWLHGFLINQLQCSDNQEQWSFTLASLNQFTSDRLWIEQPSASLSATSGELYLLDRRKRYSK